MPIILKISLIAHIILGLSGIALAIAAWVGLLKTEPKEKFVCRSAFWSFISFMFSWITGGYYYVVYYGNIVKPIIKGGAYPWVHAIIMEAKEHIFLFLPFLSLVFYLLVKLAWPKILSDAKFRKQTKILAALISVLGIIIALAGSGISGAVR